MPVIDRSNACIAGHAASATPGLRAYLSIVHINEPCVTVRNSSRHVVITISVGHLAANNLCIEGRGDRLLLIWRESETGLDGSDRSFLWERRARIRALEVSLPADVDFNAANIEIVGRTLQLRLPKQPERSVEGL